MASSLLFCTRCGAGNAAQAAFCFACGQSLQSPAADAVNDTHITGHLAASYLLKQRYCILNLVGTGGMGAVYKAQDTQLGNRLVAVKEMSQSRLTPQETAEITNAFKGEALMLAGLQHPNLPSIHEHFEEAGRWYLVMDYIEGETLKDYLAKMRGGRLPTKEVLEIGIQLCTVLYYLHTRQPPIIFRDLKPANVMRTPTGHLYLIDFGIARHFKPGQWKDTIAFGTLGYAAVEQYGNKGQTTPQSDIYSMGATLHQLLSGNDPTDTPLQFASLHALNPLIPPPLAVLISQMVEIEAYKRPGSMAIVKQELQRIAAHPGMEVLSMTPPAKTTYAPVQPTAVSSMPPVQVAKPSIVRGTLLQAYLGHTADVYGVTWSPDGKHIASGGADATIHIWDASTGKHRLTYEGHSRHRGENLVQAVMWSPDGKRIASASWDKTVQVWDAITGHTHLVYRIHSERVRSAGWSPDSAYIASGGLSGLVYVWNAANGKTVRNFLGHYFDGPDTDIVAVAWSPDGKRIASASWDKTVQVWNAVKQAKKNDYLRYIHHTQGVNTLAWSPDGLRIASGGFDNTLQIWNAITGGHIFTYRGHAGYIVAVAWSPDGRYIASGSSDRTVQICDSSTGRNIFTYTGHTDRVNAVAWSPDGARIASASSDNTVQVWQAK